VSLKRSSHRPLALSLGIFVLVGLSPMAVAAAPQGQPREYIVTLAVPGTEGTIRPSSQGAKQRIRQRAKSAREATLDVARTHGLTVRHRYGFAFSGFSATMTPAQASRLAAEPTVVAVREARTFRIAAQVAPAGIRRVRAWDDGTVPGPDVAAHVAIVDTGVGPGTLAGQPLPMEPQGDPSARELNLGEGVNCYDDPFTRNRNEAWEPGNPEPEDGWWADTQGHGTHVAGIIGARDNDIGSVGVAPGATLHSVRVFQGGSGSESAVACGIDWAIATHADATLPDIDVINLSIQGDRLDFKEDCGAALADPMQAGICRATAMGIVVVAAAGNQGRNANSSAPGGFDRVISVGALTDTDGSGGGHGPRASCGFNERDDTYASFSNFGPEVDVVAPGTCVLSTAHRSGGGPSLDGDALVVNTGTSMAAPHVSGAVARYIAEHGRPAGLAGVNQIRQRVRAAGRLDWILKSDPLWYGVNDPDPPNRVLDTDALTGDPLVRAWVFHKRFNVSGKARSRATRVDIQRGGGFGGAVQLSLAGLPAAAGSATFADASLDGTGRHDLGTTVRLALEGGPASEGAYDLEVSAEGNGIPPHSRPLPLVIDRSGPTVSGLHARPRAGRASMARSGAAQAFLRWQVSDALSGVDRARLQRKTGQASWRFAGVGGRVSARVTLKPGQANRFRVRAEDGLGNQRTSHAISVRLSVRDSASGQWQVPAGEWKTKVVPKAFRRSILLASGATDSLATTFVGRGVALAGSVGPARGTFRVRVDGGAWRSVSLAAAKPGHRKVAWSTLLDAGSHTLEVQGVSGQTALDALLIIR
jgi:subtilisin family serine protease